jgi:SRSO17 transposase
VSHDAITDYLQREKITARQLWEVVQPLVQDSQKSYLILDDSVQDKRHSRKIELVKRQYSGNEHGLVRGIGVVNLVHSDGTDHYPIDYRIYSPESDGKTKNEHFREMLIAAISDKRLQAQIILFDSWYGGVDNLRTFACPCRSKALSCDNRNTEVAPTASPSESPGSVGEKLWH